jgi:CheY-like chemotaxis protein
MFDLLMTYFGKRKKADILPMMKQENLQDLHILLVEDNEMNREIAVAILEESGMKISTAIDGKDAVTRFTEAAPGTYDCIFMDIQMPVMDGYEATRAIRSSAHPEARTIPIIAVTADVFAEDVSRALACGMNDYISKPIDYHKLITALLKFTNPARKSS